MKSFLVSATAAAVLSLLSSGAMAVVNLDDGSGSSNYATELVTPGVTALKGAAVNVTATLGFGVSNGQTRFIRLDLTNAKFGAAVAVGDLTMATVNKTIAQGGGAGSTFVIFQITATADIAQNASVAFASATPGLVIQAAGSPVQMAYSLYEDAPSAAAGGAAGRLNGNYAAQTVAGLVTGLAFTTTVNTSTVSVNAVPTYTKFAPGGVVLAEIGKVNLVAATPVLRPVDGIQVTYANLVGAGTALVLKGDFGAAAAPSTSSTGVFLGPDAGGCVAGTAPTPATPTDTAAFTTDAAPVVNRSLCFSVTAGNTVKIPAQDFTVAADITPAAGATTADIGAIAAGTFIRDGLVLKASFAETSGVSGVSRAVSLVNTSGNPAPYTVRCIVNSPNPVNGTAGTVAANAATRVSVGTPGLGCPTNGTLRGVELTFASPAGSVVGSMVSQSLSTGQASFDGMTGNK